jgi:phosphoglycolate phosphatase
MNKKLLIFDFDGTLADTKRHWFNAVYTVFRKIKLYCPDCSARLLIHFARKINDFLAFLSVPEKENKRITDLVYDHFIKKNPKLVKDFDIIKKLKYKKVILSNTRTFAIKRLLGSKQKLFDAIYGADKFDTKPSMIKKLMKKHKLRKNQVFYIADMAADVVAAKEAGCTSVIVSGRYSWNYPHEIIKQEPDYIVNHLKNIEKIINKNNK